MKSKTRRFKFKVSIKVDINEEYPKYFFRSLIEDKLNDKTTLSMLKFYKKAKVDNLNKTMQK